MRDTVSNIILKNLYVTLIIFSSRLYRMYESIVK